MSKWFQVAAIALLSLIVVLQMVSMAASKNMSFRVNPMTSKAYMPTEDTRYGWDYQDPRDNLSDGFGSPSVYFDDGSADGSGDANMMRGDNATGGYWYYCGQANCDFSNW